MKVPLLRCYWDNSWLLEQIALNLGSLDGTHPIQVNSHIFSEPTWVTISDSLAISEGLQHWITIKNLVLNCQDFLVFMMGVAKCSQKSHAVLCVFSLTSSWFSTNNYCLFPIADSELVIGIPSNKEYVWIQIVYLFTFLNFRGELFHFLSHTLITSWLKRASMVL